MIDIPPELWAKIHRDIIEMLENGYGSVEIVGQDSQIVLIKKTENYKPPVDNLPNIVKTLVKLTI